VAGRKVGTLRRIKTKEDVPPNSQTTPLKKSTPAAVTFTINQLAPRKKRVPLLKEAHDTQGGGRRTGKRTAE